MNLTSSTRTNSNPLSQLKTRYLVALGGLTIAVSMTVGGAGAMKFRPASNPPITSAEVQAVQPMFASAADAEYSARSQQSDLVPSMVSTRPETANSMVAEHADQYPVAAWPRTHAVNPVGGLAVQPMFGTAADAERVERLLIDGAAASWGEYAVPLPSELTRQQVQPRIGALDADHAPLSPAPGRNESTDEYAARERAQIDLISRPAAQQQFGTAADAE